MSTTRRRKGGWADPKRLPRGPSGRALCRWCNTEVPPRRRTFCSEPCVHQWRMRTSTSYVREQVFKRDRGVCSICQTDTVRLANFLRKLEWRARRRYCDRTGIPYARARKRSLWDADHIKAVVEGGGECDLDNLRTVCIPCHRLVTAKLMTRRRATQGTSTAAANDPDVQPGSPA